MKPIFSRIQPRKPATWLVTSETEDFTIQMEYHWLIYGHHMSFKPARRLVKCNSNGLISRFYNTANKRNFLVYFSEHIPSDTCIHLLALFIMNLLLLLTNYNACYNLIGHRVIYYTVIKRQCLELLTLEVCCL